MSIQTHVTPGTNTFLLRQVTELAGESETLALSHTDQAELLEVLAKKLGYTLVDHVESKELETLAEEVGQSTDLAARALATAVTTALEA